MGIILEFLSMSSKMFSSEYPYIGIFLIYLETIRQKVTPEANRISKEEVVAV